MVAQVIFHEARNEIIAVVVTRLKPQRDGITDLLAGRLEELWMQLALQELIATALVDEDRRPARRVFDSGHEFGRVVVTPLPVVGPEVARERFLAPGAGLGRRDRCKRGNGMVARRILESDRERSMATHRVSEDPLPIAVGCEICID